MALCVSVGVLIEGPRIGWASPLAMVATSWGASDHDVRSSLRAGSPPLVVCLGQDTRVLLLLLAYLLIGIGFGFANAPITNTAVSGLPPPHSG